MASTSMSNSNDPARVTGRQVWAAMASRVVQTRSDAFVALLDVAVTTVAVLMALILRYEGAVPTGVWESAWIFLGLASVTVLVSNYGWGLYGHLWRHASLWEARQLVSSGATITAVLVAVTIVPRPVPLTVAFFGPVMATFLMGVVRFQSRLFSFHRGETTQGMKVIVIGAGDAGASLVGDMIRSPRAGLRPVAVLDEDPSAHGRSFMGVRVEGGIEHLPAVVKATGAHLAVFAMTNARRETIRAAASAAATADVALKIVPGIRSAMNGGVSLRDLRDVQVEDLLGREQVSTDLDAVRAMLAGQRVVITGAGGSIGSEIARQVYSFEPEVLVLLDHDETHLHDVASELPGDHVVQALADIRNRNQIRGLFSRYRPTVVFHAAAHKHVPLLEAHPAEAVATNVLGTSNVLEAAGSVHAERLVFVSTDKAVYPSSVMGGSKRLGEQLVISRAPLGAAYCAVRFGNVLGSRGSVVPTFMKQINAGGPVTVTDERMTRFFMSIEEAVQLVLQAAALAEPRTEHDTGAVFMLDMGEPVAIHALAERMIRLSGRQPGTDIEIKITGIRPGEKLAEELRALDEAEAPTAHPSISRVTPVSIVPSALEHGVIDMELATIDLDDERCRRLVSELAGGELAADLLPLDRAAPSA